MLQNHPNRSLSDFRGKPFALFHGAILSENGASGKLGAVQTISIDVASRPHTGAKLITWCLALEYDFGSRSARDATEVETCSTRTTGEKLMCADYDIVEAIAVDITYTTDRSAKPVSRSLACVVRSATTSALAGTYFVSVRSSEGATRARLTLIR